MAEAKTKKLNLKKWEWDGCRMINPLLLAWRLALYPIVIPIMFLLWVLLFISGQKPSSIFEWTFE